MNRPQDTLEILNSLKELIVLWLKSLQDYCNLIVNCTIYFRKEINAENDESEKNKTLEIRKKLLVEHEQMESNILETMDRITTIFKQLENVYESHKSSYSEIVAQAFDNLPDSKKLACFISFMDIIENFKKE